MHGSAGYQACTSSHRTGQRPFDVPHVAGRTWVPDCRARTAVGRNVVLQSAVVRANVVRLDAVACEEPDADYFALLVTSSCPPGNTDRAGGDSHQTREHERNRRKFDRQPVQLHHQ